MKIVAFFLMIMSAVAFRSFLKPSSVRTSVKSFATLADGVEFDTIAREWRLKWSPDNDKKSLASAQQSM
jgi:hypothetical protein